MSLRRLFGAIEAAWPQHRSYLAKVEASLVPEDRTAADEASDAVLRIAGDRLAIVCEDYRWLCSEMLKEQMQFARSGRYRLQSFEEAREQVYDNQAFMSRYLNGLLVGRIAWIDQLAMLLFYRRDFLPNNRQGYRHVEIGPGHGLLLYYATRDERCEEPCGLDVSAAALAATEEALRALSAPRMPTLLRHDLAATPPPSSPAWDSIVISELLEHLEQPAAALRTLVQCLAPGGRIFITTPVNSPMPDHIYQFHSPEAVLDLVLDSGLRIVEHRFFTGAGISEDRARAQQLPIACAVIGERKVAS